MMNIKRAGTQGTGFTLIELMVTLAVMGVVLSIAYPSMTTTMANNRIASQGQDILTLLSFARSEAISRGDTVTIAPTNNNWRDGVTVSVNGGTVKSLPAFEGGTSISPGTSLSFDSRGQFQGSGLTVLHADASRKVVISVASGGALQLSKPACSGTCTVP